jgi:hypothetical protein
MRNSLFGIIASAASLVLCTPGLASAQTSSPNMWAHGTTVNVFAGGASASSETGALAGGAVGWEVTPWVALEGSGSWLDRRQGADAFAADLKALVNLAAARSVVPFVEGGIGMYRASFDSSRATFPEFYRARMAANAGATTRMTFADPSFIVGGGVNLFATRRMAIRPDIEAKIVRRDSQTYVVTAVSVHLAYHFEDHPIAPSRAR